MIDYREFSLPLETTLSTAAGEIEHRKGFALRVGDDPAGVGEATPLPDWTESLVECRKALAGIEDPNAALDALEDRPAARHGLSLALADRHARAEGEPLYRHFGGDPVGTVPVNATIGDASAERTADAASEAVRNGFGTVKCKIGARPVENDIERVRAVREAVRPDVSLRLDANGGWTRAEADRALDALAGLGIEYVEQPLAPDDVAGHRALADAPVPVALDETLAGRDSKEIEDFAGVADVLILKPMAVGGVDRVVDLGRRVADEADIVVTTTVDAVIARVGAVHAAAALGIERACGLATGDRLAADLGPDPAPVREGEIAIPQEPGLGTDGPWSGNGGGTDA